MIILKQNKTDFTLHVLLKLFKCWCFSHNGVTFQISAQTLFNSHLFLCKYKLYYPITAISETVGCYFIKTEIVSVAKEKSFGYSR